jgi:2-oxoglutarate ferredoxin oxidoreductase subunit alpha
MTERFGRYRDVDGDAIPYRTYPGTHPTKGAFFTRGTSRDEYAVYTENGDEYVANMQRLLRKWETAKDIVPAPEVYQTENASSIGVIFFGTSTDSSLEALDYLRAEGLETDALRVKAFPFNNTVQSFIDAHETVFVVEQNRDAQLRQLIVNEFGTNPAKLLPVLEYGGMAITAATIKSQIESALNAAEAV